MKYICNAQFVKTDSPLTLKHPPPQPPPNILNFTLKINVNSRRLFPRSLLEIFLPTKLVVS